MLDPLLIHYGPCNKKNCCPVCGRTERCNSQFACKVKGKHRNSLCARCAINLDKKSTSSQRQKYGKRRSPNNCLVPECGRRVNARGLCNRHYERASSLVGLGETTWKKLEKLKKVLPVGYNFRGRAIKEWFLDIKP